MLESSPDARGIDDDTIHQQTAHNAGYGSTCGRSLNRIGQRVDIRLLVVLLAVVLVVGCTRADPPPISRETEATLVAEAIDNACGAQCDLLTPYVFDQLRKIGTPGQDPMTKQTMAAIETAVERVVFVGFAGVEELFEDSDSVDSGAGILIYAGPVEQLAEGVVGIEIGVIKGGVDGRGETYQFVWDGRKWVPTTAEDTGITIPGWVS